jgi:hypothetical protein
MLRLILFLIINFGALGIGGLLLGNPATNEWYQSLNKAPWTPPGWVFGAVNHHALFFNIYVEGIGCSIYTNISYAVCNVRATVCTQCSLESCFFQMAHDGEWVVYNNSINHASWLVFMVGIEKHGAVGNFDITLFYLVADCYIA